MKQLLDRTKPPAFKQTLDFVLPKAELISAIGEPEIWYVPSDDHEVVQIDFVFECGRINEHIPGVGQFAIHMLNKGAGGKTSEEIANTLDYYGSHFEVSAGFDFASIVLAIPSKHLKKLLPLVKLIVEAPDFPEEELELYRKIYVENLKVNLEKNDFLASNLVREKIFGSHPYGYAISVEDAERINREDVLSFYTQFLKPSKIFIVGKIESQDLKFLSTQIRLSKAIATAVSSVQSSASSRAFFDGPNKTQASIKIGKITIQRSHPDYAALQMANYLLGGFFGSRLMKNIREEKGLTYGIYSSLRNYLHATSLIISAEVNTEKYGLALDEILKEVELLKSISEDELSIARNHFIGSLQNDVSTIFAAAERIKNIKLYGLSEDYYQKLINDMSRLKSAEIISAVEQHLSPDQLTTVVVK